MNKWTIQDRYSIFFPKDERMGDLKLQRTEAQGTNGETIRLVYDEEADILEVFFRENESATGIELTDHILLRVNQTTRQAVSLTLLHFSILTEQTEYGPRSYSLRNLEDLPEELRELTARILTTQPVNQFLRLSYFQESLTKRVPVTSVEPRHVASGIEEPVGTVRDEG